MEVFVVQILGKYAGALLFNGICMHVIGWLLRKKMDPIMASAIAAVLIYLFSWAMSDFWVVLVFDAPCLVLWFIYDLLRFRRQPAKQEEPAK